MHAFEWDVLLTRDLLKRVAAAAGVATQGQGRGQGRTILADARPVLARILEDAGGLPVVDDPPGPERRTAMALEIMHDAVRHTLATMGATQRPAQSSWGYVTLRSRVAELASVATAIDRAPLNRAGAGTIAHATGVSSSLAERIVEERRSHGPFHSPQELDRRLRGVDARNRDRIAASVRFDDPADRLGAQVEITNDFDRDLGRLVALQDGATADERLAAALETIASVCAAEPHPDTVARRTRESATALPAPATEAKWVGVLANADYYASLQLLLAAATRSIDVCMFHIACPSEEHPTRKLLAALVDAKKRRVKVRVLMDKDRPSDPYKSTVINTPARKLLEKARVDVRFDRAGRLLHSKFLVIDGELAVIGSHNWSAGSYFEFDDLTLVIASAELAGELGRRFDGLWGA